MACDVDTHGGADSGTLNSSVTLRVVRSAELGEGTKPSKGSSWIQVGVPIVEHVPGSARLAGLSTMGPKKMAN